MKIGDLKNIVKNIPLTRDIDPGKVVIAPYRHWMILVSIFFVAFVVSAVFAVYLFMGVRNESLFVDTTPKDVGVKLDVEKLEQVIKNFSTKEETSNNLKAGKGALVDPSR